jgi:hypothetical protein
LVCLTAAAAAAHHGGDLDRARRLFMEGSGLASAGTPGSFGGGPDDGGSGPGSESLGGGGSFGSGEEYFYRAAVDGEGAVYASADYGNTSPSSSSISFDRRGSRMVAAAHNRASHLR